MDWLWSDETHTLQSIKFVFLPIKVVLVVRIEGSLALVLIARLKNVQRVEDLLVCDLLVEDEHTAVRVRAVLTSHEKRVIRLPRLLEVLAQLNAIRKAELK